MEPVISPRAVDHDLVVGPADPVTATPSRRPGSVRRTTTLDMVRPDGPAGRLVIDGRGRDLRTESDGGGVVLDEVDLRIEIDPLTGLVAAIDDPVLADLVGTSARSGFGRRVTQLLPTEATRRTLRYSLLDDLNGGVLVGGYSLLYDDLLPKSPEVAELMVASQADVCAGWSIDGPLIADLKDRGTSALPIGPPAPVLDADDLDGWHPLAPMEVGAVRRRRRLDLCPAGPQRWHIDLHFRDSHRAPDGERVMHEYVLEADIEAGTVVHVDVSPRVLPWEACPGAVASARNVIGAPLDEVPARVRRELVGPATCTHLNSTLRTLADAWALQAYPATR